MDSMVTTCCVQLSKREKYLEKLASNVVLFTVLKKIMPGSFCSASKYQECIWLPKNLWKFTKILTYWMN